MPVRLTTRYSKKLGLPGFSSHMFEVSVETELATTDNIEAESRRLYELLQTNVDEQILATGFVPPADYGLDGSACSPGARPAHDAAWKCTAKQKELIIRIVGENRIEKDDVERLARERFGKSVRFLGKNEASGLIDELLGSRADPGSDQGSPPRRRNERKAA